MLLEGGHVLRILEGIVGAAKREHPGLDGCAGRKGTTVEPAVEADHALEVEPVARHLDDARAAEAIADGGDARRIELRLLQESLIRGARAGARKRSRSFL